MNQTLYHYYTRGCCHYWNESESITRQAHENAVAMAKQSDWPEPSEIQTIHIHPTRLGYAWRVSGNSFDY